VTDWAALMSELATWRREGLRLPIWWRDDDATSDTPALAQLAALARETGMQVHVAVIPDLIEPSLISALQGSVELIPVVHGWRHVSHAPPGEKNAEFGHRRDAAAGELQSALSVMKRHFGADLMKLFVPPWNRFDATLLPSLAQAGYVGLSTFGPRLAPCPLPAVVQINTHIDPIYWRGHRGLVAPGDLVARTVAILKDRRAGSADITEPLGLLTHHLVHNADIWEFSSEFLMRLLDGGAVVADVRAVLQAGRKPRS